MGLLGLYLLIMKYLLIQRNIALMREVYIQNLSCQSSCLKEKVTSAWRKRFLQSLVGNKNVHEYHNNNDIIGGKETCEMWIYSGEKQSCPLSPLLFELRWMMRESIEKLKLESIEKLKLNIGV